MFVLRETISHFEALHSPEDPGGAPTTVLYGDGKFPSIKKFERYIPVKCFKQACFKRFDMFEINEFRTSLICPDRDGPLWTVTEFFKGKYYEVRGLKWCGSDT